MPLCCFWQDVKGTILKIRARIRNIPGYIWSGGDMIKVKYDYGEEPYYYTDIQNNALIDINQILSEIDGIERMIWRTAGIMGERSTHYALPIYFWDTDDFPQDPENYNVKTDSDGDLVSMSATADSGEKMEVSVTY